MWTLLIESFYLPRSLIKYGIKLFYHKVFLLINIQDETGTRLAKSSMRLEKLLAAKSFHIPQCQVRSVTSLHIKDLKYCFLP